MLYVPSSSLPNPGEHAKNQMLIDTLQQGILYGIFSCLVVKRLKGKDAMSKYMDKVYKKLTHQFPENFLMIRKIDDTEWETIFNNWMGVAIDEKTK